MALAITQAGSETSAQNWQLMETKCTPWTFGFGNSQEEELPRGCVSDFDRHLQYIDDFVVHLGGLHKGKKLHLLGHSLGGVYALWYAANHPDALDGLVLAAPAVTSALGDRKKCTRASSCKHFHLDENSQSLFFIKRQKQGPRRNQNYA